MKIRKAVFPAAGLGTRFLPATKSQPKEMLPIVDKPVIQYLVEEAVQSGIEEIIIVTGRNKRAIEDHFDYSFELAHTLAKKGKTELLENIQKIEKLAKFVYVRQPMPLGDGDAILRTKELIGNEPFAIMFGDDIVDNETPALKQLIMQFEEKNASIIALEEIPKEKTESYGIVKPKQSIGRLHEIDSMVEKPKPKDAPSNLGVIGKYIVTPEIFKSLESSKASHGGELRLIDGLMNLQKTQKVYGYQIEGTRYDAGNTFGLITATVAYALKRKELGPQIKKYIQSLDLA